MKLASIETVKEVKPHGNADSLEVAVVLGYECIVPIGQYVPGQLVILIQPDTVLPDARWAETFRKRSNRVKAMKLRGVWSFGIVMNPLELFEDSAHIKQLFDPKIIGTDVSDIIGVHKYEPPMPQDLSAMGHLPTGLPKTDEERYQNLTNEMPFGELVDVTLKIDGQSATYFCFKKDGEWETGICSRSLRIKLDAVNNYTRANEKYNILEKLKNYCMYHDVSLALRGEVYGSGIQSFGSNPHGKLPLDFAAFSVYNMDKRKYEGPNDPHYYEKVAAATVGGIPVVPMIERQVPLTQELINKYAREINKIDGKSFEGVVIKHNNGSFKVINLAYDERK